jgi:hypothetical protein
MTTNLVETQRARIQVLLARIQELESTSAVPALEKEIEWLEGVIFNPSYNDTDIRLLVGNTPREMRMGLTTEFPEKKTYLPAQAKKAHCSEKTAGKRLRILAATGMLSYRTAGDTETGKTRAHLQPLPLLETAPIIHIERAKEGGSTWKEGKRVRRCKDCNSSNLVKKITSQIVCGDCGVPQEDLITVFKQVNAPDADLSKEEEDHSHSDTDATSEENLEFPSLRIHTGVEVQFEMISPEKTTVTVTPVSPPEELQKLPQWVVWRYEPKKDEEGNLIPGAKPDKVPYQTSGRTWGASTTNPKHWGSYEQSVKVYEDAIRWKMVEKWDGVGFVFNKDYTGIDYDHCIEEGKLSELPGTRIEAIDSYAEISPSGTGIHQIVRGTIPRGRKLPDIEMYDHGRFFTFTGQHLIGTPATIEGRQGELDALFVEITPKREPKKDEQPVKKCVYASCSDEEALDKARKARNGSGEKFRRLYDTGDWTGYPSQSEADQALCCLLAYWTNYDKEAIDRLFRDSKLMRPKWDRAARSGEIYGEGTIRMALGEEIAS